MHWDEKTKRLIVIGLAGILILLGLLGAVFKIHINPKLLNQISTILLFIAAMILFSGRRFGKKQDPPDNGAPENPESGGDDSEKQE